ncbi:peptidoglycan DD-metalloendopeptidase family protein [Marinobacterium marinum]|uniref:Peptidoglycan DD-metalloendopeptidase family protein n=1 Tax=Marinobacterium marinum TaxID=2756129 RepID=A0A7W1WYW5_9GAMM|nr:peptidoglycan DD-metalloendopeptidase family protein [Marinobacterium marinum]MBA4502788.1 peptidoglycan DD-metalloendopeptidase family protein [Marinobacterium marinum]
MPYRLLLVLTCLSLWLGGCSTGYAPVSERSLSGGAKEPAPNTYRVKKGDTLYSIAFRYGLDYRQVARLNGIDKRYFIYPGQTLRLKASAPATQTASRPGAPATPAKPPSSGRTNTTTAKPASGRDGKAEPAAGAVRWHWPHSGKIVLAFGRGQPANKGIDIAGRKGEAVKAAAHGEVVYAGNGLLGYGNMVIVNHDKRYLSAYAHNSRIFVREGDKVKAGEKIAEIGKTGATRSMLHFEIRRDGNPVDPLRYLPKR